LPRSGSFSSQSNEETANNDEEGASDRASVDRKTSGTAVQDVASNPASSLDGAAQEGSATLLLYGIVKVGLPTHERAIWYAEGVGDGRHELNVLVEDIAGAGLAQLIGAKGGENSKEDQV